MHPTHLRVVVHSVLHDFRHCSDDSRLELSRSPCTSFNWSLLWNIGDKNLVFILHGAKQYDKCLTYQVELVVYSEKCLRLLASLVIIGSGSSITKQSNFVLFKCGITRNMFDYNSLSPIIKRIIIIQLPLLALLL